MEIVSVIGKQLFKHFFCCCFINISVIMIPLILERRSRIGGVAAGKNQYIMLIAFGCMI
jgi:hypothetical protein